MSNNENYSVSDISSKQKLIINFPYLNKMYVYLNTKGKAIPLLAWTDAESSRRLRLPNFKAVGT